MYHVSTQCSVDSGAAGDVGIWDVDGGNLGDVVEVAKSRQAGTGCSDGAGILPLGTGCSDGAGILPPCLAVDVGVLGGVFELLVGHPDGLEDQAVQFFSKLVLIVLVVFAHVDQNIQATPGFLKLLRRAA